eukprot:jgi/Mesen1/2800/ME000172S01956
MHACCHVARLWRARWGSGATQVQMQSVSNAAIFREQTQINEDLLAELTRESSKGENVSASRPPALLPPSLSPASDSSCTLEPMPESIRPQP